MLHPAPRLLLALVALTALPALSGCGRQQEGERCSQTNGNSDCEDNLVCTNLGENAGEPIYRCCPEAGEDSSDERCQAVTGDGDGTGVGGAGGMSSPDDQPAGELTNCVYNSDCPDPLVCTPGGKCNYECKEDEDCDDGEICTSELSCVAE